MKSYKDELCHYGIPGQKHGKRRFQNEDGSLTAAGRARYGAGGSTDGGHGILNVRDQRAGGQPANVKSGKLSGAPAQRTIVARNPREMGVGAARKLMDRSENGGRTISRRADNGDVVIERKNADGTAEVIRQAGRTNNSSRTDSRTVYGKHGANRETYKVVGEDDIVNRRVERGIKGEKHEVVKAGSKQTPAQKKVADPRAVAARAARDADESRRNARIDASGRTVTGPNTRVTNEGGSYGITKRDKQGNERTTYTTSAGVQRIKNALGISTPIYRQKNKNGKNNVDVITSDGRIYKYVSNTGKSGHQDADMSKTRISKKISGNGIGASAARAVTNAAARTLASGSTPKKKRKG